MKELSRQCLFEYQKSLNKMGGKNNKTLKYDSNVHMEEILSFILQTEIKNKGNKHPLNRLSVHTDNQTPNVYSPIVNVMERHDLFKLPRWIHEILKTIRNSKSVSYMGMFYFSFCCVYIVITQHKKKHIQTK